MNQREASVAEIRDYFGMNVGDMRREWMSLGEDVKTFFKVGVARVLDELAAGKAAEAPAQ
jgi:hypothetical protein